MLGACNTCVRLQSRVPSSCATVDGFVCFFFKGDGMVLKIRVFHGRWGDGGASIDWKKYWGLAGGVGQFDLCWSE